MIHVVPITSLSSSIVEPEWLAKAEAVHRQLRPHLPAEYIQRMREIFATGAEMAVAVNGTEVAGLCVFRVTEKTYSGRELYCDDLVTDETQRSMGVGHKLMAYMDKIARDRSCDVLALDSGTQRQQAHKFYFREGLTIPSFHFSKAIK